MRVVDWWMVNVKYEVVVVGAFFLLKLTVTLLVVLFVASKLPRMAGKRVGDKWILGENGGEVAATNHIMRPTHSVSHF